MKTINKSPGSFYVGKDLPKRYQRPMTLKGDDLQVLIAGESRPRPVSFIMGSAEKGWHLTSKGSGPFPTGEVSYKLLEVEGREVEEEEMQELEGNEPTLRTREIQPPVQRH